MGVELGSGSDTKCSGESVGIWSSCCCLESFIVPSVILLLFLRRAEFAESAHVSRSLRTGGLGPNEQHLSSQSSGTHAFLCKFLYKICQTFLICILFVFLSFM